MPNQTFSDQQNIAGAAALRAPANLALWTVLCSYVGVRMTKVIRRPWLTRPIAANPALVMFAALFLAAPQGLLAQSDNQIQSALPQPTRPSPQPTLQPATGSPTAEQASSHRNGTDPATTHTYKVPLQQSQDNNNVQLQFGNGRVSLVARQATLREVLARFAEVEELNIVCADNVDGNISLTLHDMPLTDALTSVVSISGCTWTEHNGTIYITSISTASVFSPAVQGRQVKIFPLDFVSGEDLLPTVKTMLSPVGNAYAMAASPDSIRRTSESIVVEDLPEYLTRVEQFTIQADQPPRQVVIHVHVLQVDLDADCRHGINFSHMAGIAGHTLKIQASGLAAATSPETFVAELTAGNLTGLLEALKQNADAKTLASPKVLALNGQLARIQIGERLGYKVLKDTQTSTLEDVKFLDVGVVLSVTPTISRDERVLLSINPKVSTGIVDPSTGLPQEATSEVETNVLLRNGQGIVIGGLIQEVDNEEQSKVLFLGDLYLVGGLFQRRTVTKSRREIIFFLLPKIITCDQCNTPTESSEIEQVQTPLMHGPLRSNPRPWEPSIPNCFDKTFKSEMPRLHNRIFGQDRESWPHDSLPVETIHEDDTPLSPIESGAQSEERRYYTETGIATARLPLRQQSISTPVDRGGNHPQIFRLPPTNSSIAPIIRR